MRVICDIDGVLTRWPSTLDMTAQPRGTVIQFIQCFCIQQHELIFLTARRERYRQVTEHWLRQYFLIDHFSIKLVMHNNECNLDDPEFKLNFILQSDCLKCIIIEDSPEVISVLRKAGYLVFDPGREPAEEGKKRAMT